MNGGHGTRPRPDGERATWPGYGTDFPRLSDRLLDRYEIFAVIEGGFSLVLAVRDDQTGQQLAVKIPRAATGGISLSRESLETEVAFWLGLEPHPNVVRAYGVREVQGLPSLFMEYVGGGPFGDLQRCLEADRLSRETATGFAHQLCVAMEFVNRRGEVAHLDLKPSNLLIAGDGTLKVSDFGLACRVRVTGGVFPRRDHATWRYAAPEIFAGEAGDTRSDLYSFGVLFYEMLTGRLPFPFALSDDSTEAYEQLEVFHRRRGIDDLVSTLYYHGVPDSGDKGLGIVLSACLSSVREERARGFADVLDMLERALHLERPVSAVQRFTAEELLQHAIALRAVGRYEEALSRFNELLLANPTQGRVWLEAARTLRVRGDVSTAEEFEARAIGLDPNLRIGADGAPPRCVDSGG